MRRYAINPQVPFKRAQLLTSDRKGCDWNVVGGYVDKHCTPSIHELNRSRLYLVFEMSFREQI